MPDDKRRCCCVQEIQAASCHDEWHVVHRLPWNGGRSSAIQKRKRVFDSSCASQPGSGSDGRYESTREEVKTRRVND